MSTTSIALLSAGSALAGVALKSLLDILMERARWGREDRHRYIEQKREAYISFQRELRVFDTVQRNLAETRACLDAADQHSLEEREERAQRNAAVLDADSAALDEVRTTLQRNFDTIAFLAPAKVFTAHLAVMKIVIEGGNALGSRENGDLLIACRRDLGTGR